MYPLDFLHLVLGFLHWKKFLYVQKNNHRKQRLAIVIAYSHFFSECRDMTSLSMKPPCRFSFRGAWFNLKICLANIVRNIHKVSDIAIFSSSLKNKTKLLRLDKNFWLKQIQTILSFSLNGQKMKHKLSKQQTICVLLFYTLDFSYLYHI